MIQVTTDGGISWKNTSQNIKGMPRNGWVPQITASAYDPEEAYAVVNDYRQGDNAAYLYRTRDRGRSWQRIIDDTDVWGYVLCFAQDPVEPRLMFTGTEYGLYVSFDGGDTWNKWTSGYPTVSTYDMVIQPREQDLVIATFGRAVWILDDIRPLRALAHEGVKLLDRKLKAFEAPEAYMASLKNLPGYYFYGDAMYRGENRPQGAMISYYTSGEPGKVKAEIKDAGGKKVRSTETDAVKGFNRFIWEFDRDPLPQTTYPSDQQQDQRGRYFRSFGGLVIPGTYSILLKKGDDTASTMVKVNPDPRLPVQDLEALKSNMARAELFYPEIEAINKKLSEVKNISESIAKGNELVKNVPAFAEAVKDTHKIVSEALVKLEESLTARPDGLLSKINGYRALAMASGPLSQSEEKSVSDAETALKEANSIIDSFLSGPWASYREQLKKITLTGDEVINK